MLKALKIQQGASDIMSTNYPILYSSGLTMYPIFVYGSDGDSVLHLTTVVVDGKLSFVKDSTNKKLLNSRFKKITNSIQSAIEAGLYTPTDNIQEELNEALKNISEEDITLIISKIYDRIRIDGYTYFGTLDDEEWVDPSLPESSESFDMINSQDLLEDQSDPVENFNLLGIDTAEASPVNPSNVVPSVPKNKKISAMTIPELEERMKIKWGDKFARDYKPETYVNSLNVTNVRYVKRPKCPYEDEPVMVSRPIFSEFQGKPSVNSRPGRFGETDSDSEDHLLFN